MVQEYKELWLIREKALRVVQGESMMGNPWIIDNTLQFLPLVSSYNLDWDPDRREDRIVELLNFAWLSTIFPQDFLIAAMDELIDAVFTCNNALNYFIPSKTRVEALDWVKRIAGPRLFAGNAEAK